MLISFAAERGGDGRRLVVRNAYHQGREVLTSAGAVEVTVLRVNDKRTDPVTGERMRFASAILPPFFIFQNDPLPPGLSFGSTAPGTDNVLTGTPTQAGTFSFTLQVQDSWDKHDDRDGDHHHQSVVPNDSHAPGAV